MHSINSPARVQAALRRKEAIDYRLAGCSYREIGEQLGVTPTRARQLVKEAMAALQAETAESAEELRRLELDRLDQMQAAVWDEALAGDDKAILTIIKLMDRRAKLAGIDAPVHTINSHAVTDLSQLSDAELDARAAALGIRIPGDTPDQAPQVEQPLQVGLEHSGEDHARQDPPHPQLQARLREQGLPVTSH